MLVCKWDVTSLLILGFLSPEFDVDYFALCSINNSNFHTHPYLLGAVIPEAGKQSF